MHERTHVIPTYIFRSLPTILCIILLSDTGLKVFIVLVYFYFV